MIPSADAEDYAMKVLQAIEMVGDKYVKLSNPGELTAAAVKGVFRRMEEAIPAEIEAKIKNAKELGSVERVAEVIDLAPRQQQRLERARAWLILRPGVRLVGPTGRATRAYVHLEVLAVCRRNELHEPLHALARLFAP